MDSEKLSDVLSEFARTMVTDFPIQGILDQLVERIVEVMPITAAGVTLIEPGSVPRYIAASNDSALQFEKLQTELSEGPCLAAYQSGESVSVPDLRDEERFPTFSPRAIAAGLGAVFAFPLNHGDSQLGALDLYRDTPGALTDRSMGAAQTLADVAAAYLLNAQARADLQDSSDRSSEAALHDPLTGLPNRALMLQRLEHAFARGRRSGMTCAVLFVDLDDFKAVNDTLGHQYGDELLVAVAERLRDALRPGDTVARIAGDEFVILCEDLASRAHADVIAARVNAGLDAPFAISDTELSITASIGIAFTGCADHAPAQIIHDADLAMYRSKRKRHGGGHVLDLRTLHGGKDHHGLERSLPGAAGRGELSLAYQPIVLADEGRLTGVEALLRWSHPNRGVVSPSVLIPMAEQSGEIIDIGRWVLEAAWSDLQRWQTQGEDDLAVSVNVSPLQFMGAGFADSVASVLGSASIDPKRLTLEVTEGVFVRDGERALMVLNDLKDLGVMLALDDFGTGYSSLSYLMKYPVDAIKVDRAFVANLGQDTASSTVVTAVIQLAHGLGMTVVSEGVETAEQYRQLSRLGCDSCQGFYFAPPMPASSLDSLIQDHAHRGELHLPLPRAA